MSSILYECFVRKYTQVPHTALIFLNSRTSTCCSAESADCTGLCGTLTASQATRRTARSETATTGFSPETLFECGVGIALPAPLLESLICRGQSAFLSPQLCPGESCPERWPSPAHHRQRRTVGRWNLNLLLGRRQKTDLTPTSDFVSRRPDIISYTDHMISRRWSDQTVSIALHFTVASEIDCILTFLIPRPARPS